MTTKFNPKPDENDSGVNRSLGTADPPNSSSSAEASKPHTGETWKIPLKSSMKAGSDIAVSKPDGQSKVLANPPVGTSPLRENRAQVSMSLSTCVSSEKKSLTQLTTPLKRAAGEERTQPEKKKPDTTFLLPSLPPVRISRMSGLTAEQHERITAANAKKIEAVKLTMAEALPPKAKRPGAPVDPNAPPRKRGRPKGSVNKPRLNGAQASASLAGQHSRGVVRNGMKTDVTSRSVGTQSCMDLSERTPARPFPVHTQSSLDVSKPTKELKSGTTPLKKTETTSRGEPEDVTPPKAPPTASKPTKTTTTDKNKHRDVATAPGSSTSDTNHATSILPTLSENSYSDGDMTPPLSIVEDYVEQQKSSPGAAEAEPQSAAPPSQQVDANAKTKPQAKKKQRDYDLKIQSLSKELTSLLSSCEDQQKIKIACSLQRIISEQKDVQHILQMISRIETEVCGRSEHNKDEMTGALREYAKKCDEKLNATNEALLAVRADLARVSDQCSSLRQTSLKHANEIEAVRATLKTSCDSVRQVADELTAKLEPPPPPPPPPLQPRMFKEAEDRQQDGSPAESSNASSRQQIALSNQGGDATSTAHTGTLAPDMNRALVNQPPLFPMPAPFYGPFLPPPQKMIYDYHFHMQQLHQQMQHPLSAPLPPFLPVMEGNPLGAPFPAPMPAPVPAPVPSPVPAPTPSPGPSQRGGEGFLPQRHQGRSTDSIDLASKSRRRADVI